MDWRRFVRREPTFEPENWWRFFGRWARGWTLAKKGRHTLSRDSGAKSPHSILCIFNAYWCWNMLRNNSRLLMNQSHKDSEYLGFSKSWVWDIALIWSFITLCHCFLESLESAASLLREPYSILCKTSLSWLLLCLCAPWTQDPDLRTHLVTRLL